LWQVVELRAAGPVHQTTLGTGGVPRCLHGNKTAPVSRRPTTPGGPAQPIRVVGERRQQGTDARATKQCGIGLNWAAGSRASAANTAGRTSTERHRPSPESAPLQPGRTCRLAQGRAATNPREPGDGPVEDHPGVSGVGHGGRASWNCRPTVGSELEKWGQAWIMALMLGVRAAQVRARQPLLGELSSPSVPDGDQNHHHGAVVLVPPPVRPPLVVEGPNIRSKSRAICSLNTHFAF